MLGYINAPSPFTEDGWFKTGDRVEVDGEYYKILGRESEVINVGGNKVYPQEVENVILEMYGVEDVLVYGQNNTILGQFVCARVRLKVFARYNTESVDKQIKDYCRARLASYKVPMQITFTEETMFPDRFKKQRI